MKLVDNTLYTPVFSKEKRMIGRNSINELYNLVFICFQ